MLLQFSRHFWVLLNAIAVLGTGTKAQSKADVAPSSLMNLTEFLRDHV